MPEISRAKARTIINRVFAYGREHNLKPLSVIVLDTGGHPRAFERDDKASPGRYAIAEAKAYGAIMLGMGGNAQRDRAEAQAYFMQAVNGVFDGKVLPVPGGVLVRAKRGEIIGAVGVTGDTSENDAAAAVAGITGAGYLAED